MKNTFTLALTVFMSFCTRPVTAGGELAITDKESFIQALQSATKKNDTTLVTTLLNNHKEFVKQESLIKPLTLAIQTNNPELTLLFLKKGMFNVRNAIPGLKDTPLEMSLRTRSGDVTYAILSEKTFHYTDGDLDQAMQLMMEVENAYRPHAQESQALHTEEPRSALTSWGIGAAAVTTVGIIAFMIARHFLHR